MADGIQLDGLTITHRGRHGTQNIIDGVTFSIAPGETYGLVGKSGCGKSTIALASCAISRPACRSIKGRILVNGRDTATLTARELRHLRGAHLAMVYQDPMASLNPVMTIGRQLMEVPLIHGEKQPEKARARAIAMLDEVRLPDPASLLERYPHQLSGGQQQRVVIAMALMAEPKLLIMDEPTTGLDVTIEAAILETVRELRRRLGTAILFISHNLGTIARLCDRVGVLYGGRLVETGPIATVFGSPAHPYTRGLLAALPRLRDDVRTARLAPIEGALTSHDRQLIGCSFAPRCSFAEPQVCAPAPIPMVPLLGTDHEARCLRLGAVAAERTALPAAPRAPAGGAAEPLLTITDLTKIYKISGPFGGGKQRVRALHHANIATSKSQTLAIVGESGSGKSTLARILSGLTSATSGSAHFGARDIASLPVDRRPRDLRRRIQMVFQNPD